MKTGIYHVYMLLGRKGSLATIEKATCECTAGGAQTVNTCVYYVHAGSQHQVPIIMIISVLLHALVALNSGPNIPTPTASRDSDEDDEDNQLPVTYYLCQWKPPKKGKQSNHKFADVTFEKHAYG